VSLAGALAGDAVPERDLPLEYLAEGVRAAQVTLVRGDLKLVRGLGEPDVVYDVVRDPGERVNLAGDPARREEVASLAAAVDARWDLTALDREVRASQERRRLVARALATCRVAPWDLPAGDAPTIRTGEDFWEALERARRV
jgi:choline-sulfatase